MSQAASASARSLATLPGVFGDRLGVLGAAHAASPISFSYITQPSTGAIPARS
jgi:hypothetical protein